MAKGLDFVKPREKTFGTRTLEMERTLYWYRLLSLKYLGNLLLRAALYLIYIIWLFNLHIFCVYCKLLWNISPLHKGKPQAFYIWLLPVTICNSHNFFFFCLILQVQILGWYRKRILPCTQNNIFLIYFTDGFENVYFLVCNKFWIPDFFWSLD